MVGARLSVVSEYIFDNIGTGALGLVTRRACSGGFTLEPQNLGTVNLSSLAFSRLALAQLWHGESLAATGPCNVTNAALGYSWPRLRAGIKLRQPILAACQRALEALYGPVAKSY